MPTDQHQPLPRESGASLRPIELEAGTLIEGKYRLVRPAGFGGMAAIWVARNEATGAEVAVKLLLADRTDSSQAFERFRREAHAAAKLSHRAIVRVFDLLELEDAPGSLAMVMELLHGRTLMEAMEDKRTFTVDETLEILMPVLSGLAHAHRAGIVHRDLKPENIFLCVEPDGHTMPKILDFGISKLTTVQTPSITTDGALLGTPSYMSPEQARGARDADARSDVFTIGILLYEMLSGRNPFTSGSYHSVVAAILERDPDPIRSITPELWAVIEKALSKKPSERFKDAGELSDALRAAVSGWAGRPSLASMPDLAVASGPRTVSAPASSRPSQPSQPAVDVSSTPAEDGEIVVPVRRTGWLVAVVAAAVLAGAGLFVLRGPAASNAPAASAAPVGAPPDTGAPPIAVPPPPADSATAAASVATSVTPQPSSPVSSAAPGATKRSHGSGSGGKAPRPGSSAVVRDPGF